MSLIEKSMKGLILNKENLNYDEILNKIGFGRY